MKGIECICITLVLMVVAIDCFSAEEPAAKESADKKIIAEGNNRFALELYARLREQEGNLFFSPYSISTALAMVYAGASGETEAQMAEVLHFPIQAGKSELYPGKGAAKSASCNKQQFHSAFGAIIKDLNARGEKGGYELVVANALWGQTGYGFLQEFLQLIEVNYGGALNKVDFIRAAEAARTTINAWVEKQTKDKIKELIQPGVLNQMTRLVLTNAIYFKGNWASRFKKETTKEAPFTLLNGNKVNVAMMNQTAEFKYMEASDFQALELPYVGDELSMIILLPKEFDGLNEFEKELTIDSLSKWLGELRTREVIVSVPKFQMSRQFGLAGILESMGMTDAFSPRADFSGISGNKDLFISAVIHKAYVDVNEEGTEAAAATGIVMKLTAVGPSRTPVFRADHPFVFLIRDNHSGSILFIGRTVNPK
ncbi:MAG TPA: serpin family protein [Sedimentisphaerales bacterium]|nr:serpin family protein [Sedimentisphaerales bacterium]